MTRSKAVGSAQELNQTSKHWANFARHPMGSLKEQYAVKAETLFFTWLWKKE